MTDLRSGMILTEAFADHGFGGVSMHGRAMETDAKISEIFAYWKNCMK